jgi:riboflavin kinase/FMN adenylyltransferase
MTAREFIASLVAQWRVQTLLVGYNHRFGFQRTEGIEQYIRDGKVCGLEVIRTSSFSDDTGAAVSSSMVRRLIETGHMEAVSGLLGYHYQLKGHVIDGNHIGRRLGFPTANIELDEKFKVIPRSGSYAVRITIDHNKYNGMAYIGDRPTIDTNDALRIEANIFDFSENIYNQSIIIEFVAFIRIDKKFDSLDELREQMREDMLKAITVLNR